ncbi:hypothetical protein QE152_g24730 [Popillia japonica]|uniref:Uncharacterized protein n=1 Tax=Popillia japonica TaxID=7064 RepID=A0AAW1K2R8_POPJA
MADMIVKDFIPKTLGMKWSDCITMEGGIELMKEAAVYPIQYLQVFSGKYEDSQYDAPRRFKSELLIEMDGILGTSKCLCWQLRIHHGI